MYYEHKKKLLVGLPQSYCHSTLLSNLWETVLLVLCASVRDRMCVHCCSLRSPVRKEPMSSHYVWWAPGTLQKEKFDIFLWTGGINWYKWRFVLVYRNCDRKQKRTRNRSWSLWMKWLQPMVTKHWIPSCWYNKIISTTLSGPLYFCLLPVTRSLRILLIYWPVWLNRFLKRWCNKNNFSEIMGFIRLFRTTCLKTIHTKTGSLVH